VLRGHRPACLFTSPAGTPPGRGEGASPLRQRHERGARLQPLRDGAAFIRRDEPRQERREEDRQFWIEDVDRESGDDHFCRRAWTLDRDLDRGTVVLRQPDAGSKEGVGCG
jgi:hypothetical protein